MIYIHIKDKDFSIWSEFEEWVKSCSDDCIEFNVRIDSSSNFDELRGFRNAADLIAEANKRFIMQIQIGGNKSVENINRIYKAIGDFGIIYADPMHKTIYFCSDTSFLAQEENTMDQSVVEKVKESLVNNGLSDSSALKICRFLRTAKMRTINDDNNDVHALQKREFCFIPIKENQSDEIERDLKYPDIIFNYINNINFALLSISRSVHYDISYKVFVDIEKTVISVSKNTRTGWQNAFELYKHKNDFLRNFYTEFKFNVELQRDDFSDKTDVTNLRFFYPLNKLDERCVMNVITDDLADLNRAYQFCTKCPNAVLINNSQHSKQSAVSDIFPIIKIDNSNNIMHPIDESDALKEQISDYESYFTIGHSKDTESIIRMKNEAYNILIKYKNSMPALTYLMLIYLLRFYIGTEKSDTISESTLVKIITDAESYSEGFYQIIENSCLHSHGHCAYFSMRIHKANRNATMSVFEKEQKTRQMLYDKYSEKRKVNNIFNSLKYNYYIEFFVIDCAVSGNNEIDGILDTFNRVNEQKVASIEDLITLTEEMSFDKEKYYTEHYGLRWFEKIIDKNHGIIHIFSPFKSGKETSLYVSSNGKIEENSYRSGSIYFTEYNVVVPMLYAFEGQDAKAKPTKCKIKMLDRPDIEFKPLAPKAVTNIDGLYNLEKKSDKIECIHNELKGLLKESNSILQIDCTDMPFDMVEITAKAIFKSIYEKRKVKKNMPIYISIDFGAYKERISEFVRIFSIFYDKSGDNGYMNNVQIALCGNDEIYKIKKVYFIIAGNNLRSAYETALKLFYYDSYYMAENMYVLDYLADGKNGNKSKVKSKIDEELQILPFDIYLPQNRNSWFLKHMSAILNTKIEEANNGCKIENTHVRISSRIHLEDFYEAEHLFHNEGNVYRFAMLISKEIISSHQENKNMLIVGYENYSSILINLIQSLVQNVYKSNKMRVNVCSAISTTNESGINDIVTMNMPKLDDNDKLYVYTVIPIGTTMSTIYKIHNIVRNKFENNFIVEFKNNYSIIAVSDYLANPYSANTDNMLLRRYWDIDRMTKDSYEIILQKEISDECDADSRDTKVKYYLAAYSKWHDPENCVLCKNAIPLIQVDKTSTIPSTIIISEKNNERHSEQFNLLKASQSKLSELAPEFKSYGKNIIYVNYSHTVRGENHYQFYFDFQKLLSEKRKFIEDWLKQITIDNTAYSILVSPLNATNPMFLSLLMNKVFSPGVRFLHADINSTLKENIKVRYSYIAEEIKELKKVNPKAKINVYYADDSMVSGRTAERGKMFVKMLLDYAKISMDGVSLYKKIFLLINRNSYETMSSLTENPLENVHSYIWLSLPSYNTNNGICPSCEVQNQFELLKKRSATVRTAREFARLQRKHEKRTPEEYEVWLENEILNTHAYFAWLKLWLFYNAESFDNKNKTDFKSLCDRIVNFVKTDVEKKIQAKNKYQDFNFFKLFESKGLNDEIKDEYLNALSKHSLNDFLEYCGDDSLKEKLVGLMRYIVAERAHLRLTTMNEAYLKLHNVRSEHNREDNPYICNLLTDFLKIGRNDNSDPQIYLRFETTESAIKVISRDLLGKYFHVRSEILDEMKNIVMILAGDMHPENGFDFLYSSIDDKSVSQKFKNPCAALQYQLFMAVIHRMAMLRTNIIYIEEFMDKFVCAYNRLRDKYFFCKEYSDVQNALSKKEKTDLLCLTEIPSSDKVAEKYMCSVKAASMLTDDDSACFALLKSYKKEVSSDE